MSAGLRPLEYLLLRRAWGSTSGAVNPGPSPRLRQVLQPQAKRSRLSAPERDTLYIRLRDWVWGGRKPPSLRPSPLPPRPRRGAQWRLQPQPAAGGGRGAARALNRPRGDGTVRSGPPRGFHSFSTQHSRSLLLPGFFFFSPIFLNRWVRGRELERRPSLVWKRRAPTP